jgi:hypothetical protein
MCEKAILAHSNQKTWAGTYHSFAPEASGAYNFGEHAA